MRQFYDEKNKKALHNRYFAVISLLTLNTDKHGWHAIEIFPFIDQQSKYIDVFTFKILRSDNSIVKGWCIVITIKRKFSPLRVVIGWKVVLSMQYLEHKQTLNDLEPFNARYLFSHTKTSPRGRKNSANELRVSKSTENMKLIIITATKSTTASRKAIRTRYSLHLTHIKYG